jgi:hypothetical protein
MDLEHLRDEERPRARDLGPNDALSDVGLE